LKFLISLAWKNLSRHKKRTAITASAIAVGLAGFIFFDSWLLGAQKESERNLIWFETGSARILHQQYWDKKDQLPLKYVIENPDAVTSRLEELNIPATPRIVFGGELTVRENPFAQDGSLPVKIFAVDPKQDNRVFRLDETIAVGRPLQQGEEGILMGAWMAEDLGAEIGYPLTIVTTTRDGYRQTIDVEIVGIINCPNPVINRSSIFIPLDTAERYLEMHGGVTEIDLRFPERADADLFAASLEEKLVPDFPELEIVSWRTIAGDFVALAGMKQSAIRMILFLVFVIAAVGVSNTMLMAIYDRFREIGMMRALGMKDAQIRFSFLFESAGIGLIGSISGILLGVILCLWIINKGVDLTVMSRSMDIGYRIAGISRGAWHPAALVRAFFLGIMLSVTVAFLPTRRALKLSITDCLRYR
jgi:putative ABC transport system permease protein